MSDLMSYMPKTDDPPLALTWIDGDKTTEAKMSPFILRAGKDHNIGAWDISLEEGFRIAWGNGLSRTGQHAAENKMRQMVNNWQEILNAGQPKE